jgi:hypothetical protein
MKNLFKLFEAIRSIAIIALAAVIGFSMAGCGPEEEETPTGGQSDAYGRWVSDPSERELEISANSFEYINQKNAQGQTTSGFIMKQLTWEAVTNTGTNASDYPNGYKITGTITDFIGSINLAWDDQSNISYGSEGGTRTATFYFKHDDKNEFYLIDLRTWDSNPFKKR